MILALPFITCFLFYIGYKVRVSSTLFSAFGSSGREEDQISCGTAGGDPNEEA